MGAGADATDTLGECPGIARVATLEDHLQAAPHGAGRHRIADNVGLVDVDLDTQVALDAGDGVHHHTLAGVVQVEAVGSLDSHGLFPRVFGAGVAGVGSCPLQRGQRRVCRDPRAHQSGGSDAHLVGVGLNPERRVDIREA